MSVGVVVLERCSLAVTRPVGLEGELRLETEFLRTLIARGDVGSAAFRGPRIWTEVARPEGLEPPTPRFAVSRQSVPLGNANYRWTPPRQERN